MLGQLNALLQAHPDMAAGLLGVLMAASTIGGIVKLTGALGGLRTILGAVGRLFGSGGAAAAEGVATEGQQPLRAVACSVRSGPQACSRGSG